MSGVEEEKEVLRPSRPQNQRGKLRPIEYKQIPTHKIDIGAIVDSVLVDICESDKHLKRFQICVEELKMSLMNHRLFLTLMAMLKLFNLRSVKVNQPIQIEIKDLEKLLGLFGQSENFESYLMKVTTCIKMIASNIKIGDRYLHWEQPIYLAGLINSMLKATIISNDTCLKNVAKILFPKMFLCTTLKYPEMIVDTHNQPKFRIIVVDCPTSIIKTRCEKIKEEICKGFILKKSLIETKVTNFIKEWVAAKIR